MRDRIRTGKGKISIDIFCEDQLGVDWSGHDLNFIGMENLRRQEKVRGVPEFGYVDENA